MASRGTWRGMVGHGHRAAGRANSRVSATGGGGRRRLAAVPGRCRSPRVEPNETTISAANVARLRPAWIASVLQYPPVEPVVAGNRLYVASYNEATFQLTIKAKNAATGATLWTQSVRSDPLVDIAGEVHNVDPRLAVAGGRLFVASSDTVDAFDAASGRSCGGRSCSA